MELKTTEGTTAGPLSATVTNGPASLVPAAVAEVAASECRALADRLQNELADHEEAHRATERLRDAAVYLENLANRLATPNTSPA